MSRDYFFFAEFENISERFLLQKRVPAKQENIAAAA